MADGDNYKTNNFFGQKPAKKEATEAAKPANEALLNAKDNQLIVVLSLNFIPRRD